MKEMKLKIWSTTYKKPKNSGPEVIACTYKYFAFSTYSHYMQTY